MAIHMTFGNSPPWTRGYDDITCERMKEYCRIGFGYAWMNFYPKTDFETEVSHSAMPCPCLCGCRRQYGPDSVFAQLCHHCLFHHSAFELALVAVNTKGVTL